MTKTSMGLLSLWVAGWAALSCSGGSGKSRFSGEPGDGTGGRVTRGTGGRVTVETGGIVTVGTGGRVTAGTGGIVVPGKDGGVVPRADSGGSSDLGATTGSITGVVTLVGGGPAAGATVTFAQSKATTGVDGSFSFPSVAPVDRAVLTIASTGYIPNTRTVRVRAGVVSRVEASLGRQAAAQQLDASIGGTAANGTATVVLPAAGLVDASGNPFLGKAGVSITPFDPTTTYGQDAFPGEFRGISDTGQEIPIMSYGYMDVTITDGQGNLLQLAPGKTAEITIPIPASLAATAPATMPTWYFDPSDGQWHQMGVGVKLGTIYKHSIPHFSIWNSDVGYDRSYVKGRVIGCDGKPLKGATVAIRGVSPRNCWTSGERSTDDSGLFPANDDPWGFRYSGVPVDASGTASIVAMKDGASSAPLVFNTPGSEQVVNLGDFCVCATSVCGAKDAGMPPDGPRDTARAPDGRRDTAAVPPDGPKDTAVPPDGPRDTAQPSDGPAPKDVPTDTNPGSGNYSYSISGLTGSCETETNITGSADVVITGAQVSMTLYSEEGDPLTLTGTITGTSWSTTGTLQYTWNDTCIENDLISAAGTVAGSTFTGTLQISESYSGQCTGFTNCQSSGRIQLTKL